MSEDGFWEAHEDAYWTAADAAVETWLTQSQRAAENELKQLAALSWLLPPEKRIHDPVEW